MKGASLRHTHDVFSASLSLCLTSQGRPSYDMRSQPHNYLIASNRILAVESQKSQTSQPNCAEQGDQAIWSGCKLNFTTCRCAED